ncbi:response regulator [uncultured Thiodictyon sp.]|uniref:response regulator n=1 Tax=uncultured Thiodictyon sp. TaxID=1846217 RepID=UPI0025F6258A|nr:response regulator [uncultured Thiodictyon sp.]
MGNNTAAVLVVEDVELVRTTLARLLQRWGWSVAVAASGDAAFDLLCTHRYGCVVSDHQMPAGDGLSLARRWNAILDPTTPILIQTAERSTEVLNAYRALSVPVLMKGADPDQVREWVQQALKLRRE